VRFERIANSDEKASALAPERHPLADDPLVKKSIELFGGKLIQPRR
jgi:hypothetical protein